MNTNMNWNDFNDAEQQTSFDLIPKGTIARVRMTIKPGGHHDASRGWTDGYATASVDTGSVYLSAEFVVLEGPFAKRKLWSNVGLFSPKGDTWANMGRTFIRAALNSSRHIHPGDSSPQALNARRIAGFGELDGIEFIARIDIEKDAKGIDKNTIKNVIEPDHKDYPALTGYTPNAMTSGGGTSGAPAVLSAPGYTPPMTQRPQAPSSVPGGKPAWAQ